MDNLHRPEEYPFISDPVDVRKFFEEARAFKEKVVNGGPNDLPMSRDMPQSQLFAQRMGCSEEMVNELAALCDVERLKCGLEEEDDPLNGKVPPEGQKTLVTLEIQQRELQRRKQQLSYRQMACQLHKYKRMNFQVLDMFRDANEKEGLKVGYIPPDVVMAVSFAKPYNRVLEYHEIRLGRLLTMDMTFLVRGSLPLTALRDRISCLCDWSAMHDCSDYPDATGHVLAKEVYKSGFFYINGTFYNDMREDCFDLSAPILDWAKRRLDEVGPFTTANMQDTKFVDLKLRLGQPYVYIHQGTCEHLIIFSDLRMMSSSDPQKMTDYPLLTSLKPKKRVACCGCKIYTAKWVTFGNMELPFDPGFFCDTCYHLFNYDKDGNKIGDFQAMPYYDRSILP